MTALAEQGGRGGEKLGLVIGGVGVPEGAPGVDDVFFDVESIGWVELGGVEGSVGT